MPQFDVTTFASQIFWLCVCLTSLILFSARFSLPRLKRVFLSRWEKIEGSLQETEALNRQAEELVASYESELKRAKKRAHDVVLGTSRQASADLSRRKMELAKEHKKRFRDSELALANKKASAMGDVQRIAHNLVEDLLTSLGGETSHDENHQTAISTSILKRVSNEH